MKIYGAFPAVRMRRMRRDDFSRRLMREHVLTTDDLIYPVFIIDGENRGAGAFDAGRRALTDRPTAAGRRRMFRAGIPALALFPVSSRS